jgi:ketosteroid isomerase-like protein
MTKLKNLGIYPLIAVIGLFATATVQADDKDDATALLNAYIETESDLNAQSKLMSEDRIYIVGSPAMRMTDNEANMMGQAFGEKRREAMDSKSLYYATIEDQIVRMYGDAAVASFRRNINFQPSAAGMKNGMSNNTNRQLVTVVMAKIDGDWKIVHTHISPA